MEYVDIHMQKNECRPRAYYILHKKINSKWVIDLSVRVKTIKLLLKNRKNIFEYDKVMGEVTKRT